MLFSFLSKFRSHSFPYICREGNMSIQIQNVNFSYGDHVIFSDLSLLLPENGFVLLLGPSGSGKTTFLSLLNKTLLPDSGTIAIDSTPSCVFQSPLLLPYLTVEENIALPLLFEGNDLKEAKKSATPYLKRLGLENLKDKLPGQLSGGEAVRVSICRGLIKGEHILILDEPTGQLDEMNSENIYQLLKELSKDHLIILVSHDEIRAGENADFIYLLKDRKIQLLKQGLIHPEQRKEKGLEKGKKKMRMNASFFLNLRFLRMKKKRTFFSILFLSLNCLLLYLGLNLNFHMDTSIDNLIKEYYAYDTFSISMVEEVASSGNLHLKKNSIPSDEVLSILNLKKVHYSLEYFIPAAYEINLNRKTFTSSIYPFMEEEKERLKIGKSTTKETDIIVNLSFVKESGLDEKQILNRKIHFSKEILLYSTRFKAEDPFELDFDFTIVGISKEKEAFNKPIIYYPYEKMLLSFRKIELCNISEELDRQKSLYDMIMDSEYDQDDFKSNCLYAEDEKPERISMLSNHYFKKKVKVNSPSLDMKESTKDILSSLLKVLSLFLLLNTISCVMLEFLSVYSLYEDQIRLFALLKAFNTKKNLGRLVLGLAWIFIFLSLFLTFVLSLFSTTIINALLLKNNFVRFLSFFDAKAFLLIILLTILCCFLASFLPLRKISDSRINKELEGED